MPNKTGTWKVEQKRTVARSDGFLGIQVPLTRIPESSTRNPESLAWSDPYQFWVAVSAEERELKVQSKLRTFCFTFSLVGCFLIFRSETNYSWKSLPVECPCLTMKWTMYELFILDLRQTGNAWQILIYNHSFVIKYCCFRPKPSFVTVLPLSWNIIMPFQGVRVGITVHFDSGIPSKCDGISAFAQVDCTHPSLQQSFSLKNRHDAVICCQCYYLIFEPVGAWHKKCKFSKKYKIYRNTYLAIYEFDVFVFHLRLHFESHFHPWGELIGTHNSLYCVNDIWNKSYMNCGNEMKMKKWSSHWTQFTQFAIYAIV